jgi:hypothetical protein
VVTGAASGISATGATLAGTANPRGTATSGSFQYGLTTSYGSTTPAVSLGAGMTSVAISGGALTLTAALYHYAPWREQWGLSRADATFDSRDARPVYRR